MGTVGSVGRRNARRTATVVVLGLAVAVGLLLFPFSALASHDASDFFVFARAELGSDRKSNETDCDSSNDKQAEVSGSNNTIQGRIHSNADIVASSGSGNTFHDELTYGTHDEDCQEQSEGGNTYNAGEPTDLDADPDGVNGGWPGDLASYVTGANTIGSINQALAGEDCDVGSLSESSDYTVNPVADNGKVICRGSGKVQLNTSNITLSLTIVSHGLIEISGQNVTLTPATHGVVAFTDHEVDVAIKIAGSNFHVPESSIFFAPRGGIDTSGSDDAEMCIQLIGQGPIKVPGSNSIFGPGSAACTSAPPPEPDVKVTKTGNGTVNAGQTAQFTIEIENIGDAAATNVALTPPDTLPNSGLDWSIASQGLGPGFTGGSACSLSAADELSCSIASLAPGAAYRVVVTAPVTNETVCGDKPNTVTVTAANEPQDELGNNTDSDTITVQCPGQIVVQKETNPDGAAQVFSFSASYDGDGFSLSDGQSSGSGPLVPGTYSVSENVPAGWDLDSATCSDGSNPSSIGLASGETVTCTFTNEKDAFIVVEKQTLPDGDPQSFTFSASYDGDGFSLSDGQQSGSGDLDPGTYSVSETVPAGWALQSAVCSDGSPANAIDLAAGETVTCVFTNRKVSRILVEKQTNPDGDPQSFTFSASYDGDGFSLSDGQQNDSGPLTAGTYSVSETVPAGWDLESAVCSDGSNPNTIGLAVGETVTCVFTNEKDAVIVVEKQTTPDGHAQSFDFSASYDASGFSLSDGQQNNSGDLDPGTYSVAETVPTGWDLTSATCNDGSSVDAIGLAAGETVTCVFSNSLRPGTIIVEKQTNPDGDPQSFAFTASYDGDGFSLSDGQSNNSGALTPGTYSVSETVPAGWDLESATCSDDSPVSAIVLGADETVTCVFTNEKDASIVVEKQTLPDGDPQAFTFSASYDGDGFSLSDGQSNDSGDLDPGTYSVSETVPAGWDLESAVCSDQSPVNAIALAAGETVTCVFTNEKDSAIIVEKQTLPNGDPRSFTFTASYDNDGFALSDGQSNNSGDLDPGTYSVSETVPAGWDLESAVCSDDSPVSAIELAAGETVTCVFTNEKDASIVVEKQTLPNGDPQVFDFTASYDGDGFSLSDGQQNDSGDLDPGTYSVSETVPAGWDLESATCSDDSPVSAIALAAGETVTCVFTNEKDASIVVEKQTLPDGDPQVFSFTASYDGDGFSLSDGQSNDSGDLDPGTYSVSETVPAGWDLDSAVCSDGSPVSAIALSAGETVTCTFTNEKDASIVVEKQTNPDGALQLFSFTASYDGDGFSLADGQQNDSGDLDPGTYSVAETVPAGWDLESATCSDGSPVNAIALSAGETVTCVFTNEKDAEIIVEKETLPNGAAQVFDFTASYDANGFSLSDGQQNDSGDLDPGTYSVAETVPTGWDLKSATCSDDSPVSAIALSAGETVTCVFTNEKDASIVVEKQTLPNGDPQSFSFTASYDGDGFSLSDGQQNDSGDLDPGTYSVAETVPAGWDLESATCSDDSPVGAIVLSAGETVTCVFTNEKDASIVVEKQTNPDGALQLFSFTASYDGDGFSLSDGQQDNSGDLDPGTYSVSETVPAGWDLESAVCSDGSNVSAIGLSAGETVTCVFTNEKDAFIVVEKQTVPNAHQQSFDFSASYDANGFSLSDGQSNNSGDLDAGTYSVSETVPTGWDLSSAICDDGSDVSAIGLTAGETVTCVFTNTQRPGKIVVEKQTVPDGDPQSFAFTASYDLDGFSLSDGQQNDSGPLTAGTYSVSETVPAGWDLTSAVCSDGSEPSSIALAADETVTCVFTNRKRGEIIVEKQTLPDGAAQVFDFTASYDNDGFSLSDGQQSSSGLLLPGTYSVSETVPAGWDLESAVCSDGSNPSSIGLAAGETVTCVFTNEKDAVIIVEKQTRPDGMEQSFDFNASYDESGFSLSDGQSSGSGDLDPGSYSVSETVPDGWELESAVCDDQSSPASIDLDPGETVTCVFTNTKDGSIIVEKQTIPNGDPQEFEFDADYDEGGFALSDGEQNDSGDLAPGIYSVSENVPDGWDLTSAVCDDESDPDAIDLDPGETVTCVFTNTKRGTIIVEKQTSPDGAAGSFTFTGDAAGSIGDNGQIVVSNLVAGTYTSSEAESEGFSLTSISCDDANSTGSVGTRTATFRLEAGETVKCTFSNSKLGQGSIDVIKSVEPTVLKEPGGQVTYSVTIRNTSADADVTITSVVDDRFGDLENVAGGNPAGCFDLPINLAPGEGTTCLFPKNLVGVAGTPHVNTVTASGNDEFGNPVSDSDDARVDFTPRSIDLEIVKEATSPTPLDGIVTYTMTVTNKGPDTATNVQLADPAPAGITYLTATPSQGTCSVAPALITCSLGTIEPGQTVRIRVTGRATQVGRHVNVATVTGSGGRETNPADNVDDAVTIVPAPLKPPVAKPKKKPKPEPEPVVCLTLTVSPKMIKADGKPDKVTTLVTAGKKRMKGVKVVVKGPGVHKSARSNRLGIAVLRVNPKKAGIITITALETRRQQVCGPKRIGVVGVFLPPLTG